MWRYHLSLLLITVFVLGGCATPRPEMVTPPLDDAVARNLVVFFDGTENEPSDQTNVTKLLKKLLEQERPDIWTFYIEGVGVGGKLIGAGTAWGVDYRVKRAYGFLLEHYREGDKVHIFGFSRGAFTARILAAMLNYGGLSTELGRPCRRGKAHPASEGDPYDSEGCFSEISELVYQAYKGNKKAGERSSEVDRVLGERGLRFARPIQVSTLGLWDSVEAFGLVDTWEAIKIKLGMGIRPDPGERNQRYGDQLCNVSRAMHALSIDDNRADVFTPKLLTLPHLYRNCRPENVPPQLDDFAGVNEVWFSGAHSDVGGGYPDCERRTDCISNVSLNWMMREMVRESPGLLSNGARLEADGLADIHDAEDGSWLYRRAQRNVLELVKGSQYPPASE